MAGPAPLPAELARARAAAYHRLGLHSRGAGLHGRYWPLDDLITAAAGTAGPKREAAVAGAIEACEAVASGDEMALAVMIDNRRPAPGRASVAEAMVRREAMATQINHAAREAQRPRVGPGERLAWLEQRGIRITVQNGDLHVQAPPGVMTNDDRQTIRAHKDLFVAHLATATEVF